MSIITTSNRGQIVIPKAIRNKLQIGPGKKLSITRALQCFVIYVYRLYERLSCYPHPGHSALTLKLNVIAGESCCQI